MQQSVKQLLARCTRVVLRNDGIRDAFIEGLGGRSSPLEWHHSQWIRSAYRERAPADSNFDPRPVFISARFRSGSTLLWQLFRHLPGCTAYYEPLNERAWFRVVEAGFVDNTHVGVRDYHREYAGLGALERWFDERWNERRLYLAETARIDGLYEYLRGLVRNALGRPVLQFNRVDFRLPWLAHRFSTARIVHLRRDPRDQWVSILRRDLGQVSKALTLAEFEPYDHYYLAHWVRDLQTVFPALEQAWAHHPYVAHFLLWELSNLFAERFAGLSVDYERLVMEPEWTFQQILAFVEMEGRLPSQVTISKPSSAGRDYADDAWYRGQERIAESLLQSYLLGDCAADSPG